MPASSNQSLYIEDQSGNLAISSTALYKALPFASGRHHDWITRSHQKIQKVNNKAERPLEEEFSRSGNDYQLSVKTALAYLTYGPNWHMTTEVRSQIEWETGISLDSNRSLYASRYEDVFAYELEDTLDGLFHCEWTLVRQKPIGPYKVDFYLEPCEVGRRYGRSTCIIEFDEEYHRLPEQAERDRLRDSHIFELTGIKVIRVPKEKAELWLEICHCYWTVGLEELLTKWVIKDVDEKSRLYSKQISPYVETSIHSWFDSPRTNMELGKRILAFLGWSYREGRDKKGRYLELVVPVTFKSFCDKTSSANVNQKILTNQ